MISSSKEKSLDEEFNLSQYGRSILMENEMKRVSIARNKNETIIVKEIISDSNEIRYYVRRKLENIIKCRDNSYVIKTKGITDRDFDGSRSLNTIFIEEYAANGSLENLVFNEYKTINNSTKMIILYGIAKGMKEIHQENIIHGNLKPSNILLDENNYPLISDIGYKKDCSYQDNVDKDDFLYSAPEIVLSNGEIDYCKKSDVFSFGMLIYYILTGKKPYDDYPNMDNNDFIGFLSRKDSLRLPPDVPSYFCYLISLMWKKNSIERPSFSDIVNLFDAGIVFPSIRTNAKEMKFYTGYAIEAQDSFSIECAQSMKNYFKSSHNDKLATVISYLLADFFDDPISQKEIAKNFYFGTIFKKDQNKAFIYFQKSAKHDKEALFYLGQCYLNGIGCEKNKKKADNYFEKSSQNGFEFATTFLQEKEELSNVNDENEPVAILIGSYSVGKTTFLKKFINEYDTSYSPSTQDVLDYKIAFLNDGNKLAFRLRDTLAMERFSDTLPHYCRDVSIAIVMFDLSDRSTFDKIDRYIEQLNNNCYDPKIILIGNKVDKGDERNVDTSDIISKSFQYHAEYVEISSKNGTNMDIAKNKIANAIQTAYRPRMPHVENVKIINTHEKKKSLC